MTIIRGKLDLSQLNKDQVDPDLRLQAAVVRKGRLLGTTVLNIGDARRGRLPFDIEFNPPFLPEARRPCPVIVLIGPYIRDEDFLQVNTLRYEVELTIDEDQKPTKGHDKSETKAVLADQVTAVDLGQIAINPERYLGWLRICRTYTIRGRVVCRNWRYDPIEQQWTWCDDPVPGATVEAYDVDHFLWWRRRDFVTSTTTNLDGTFTMTFTWCCRRRWPWLDRPWQIDPDLLERIRHLLQKQPIPIPIPIPDPPFPPSPRPDPTFLQDWAAELASRENAAQPTAALSSNIAAANLGRLLPASPELHDLHVWPWYPQRDCAPDIVFRVTQPCGGSVNVIYTEDNSQTRWNIPTELDVTLLANDNACCIPLCRDPECPECLDITQVGCTPAALIGDAGDPADLRGYARIDTEDDRPFYANMRVRGNVGWDVDYLKVQYSLNGGSWTDLAAPYFGGYGRSYWDGSDHVPVAFAPALKDGQWVIMTRRHYEDLHPAIPRFGGYVHWNDFTSLFNFNTTPDGVSALPDGLYQFRFVGYSADSSDDLDLSSERVLPVCGQTTMASLYLRIDNQAMIHPPSTPMHPFGPGTTHTGTSEPEAFVREIWKNEGTPQAQRVEACDIVRLAATDTLTIHFTASAPANSNDGHLGGYSMTAEYGYSGSFPVGTGAHGTFTGDPTPIVGPSYSAALAQGAPRPHWYGGDYQVTLRGSDFPACCAYLLRLHAWKRTTNGCSNIKWTHYNRFAVTFTVLRPEHCPDVCDEDDSRPDLDLLTRA